MHVLTLLGLIIIAVVVLAAAGGWATSGTTRLGREIGLLAGLAVALLVLPHVSRRIAALLALLGASIGGATIGAALLGAVGNKIAHGLYRLELGTLDRLLGTLLSAIGTVALCAIALHVLALVDPAGDITRTARHDAIAHWLTHNRTVEWL